METNKGLNNGAIDYTKDGVMNDGVKDYKNEVHHILSKQQLEGIQSIKDPIVQELMEKAPDGKNPFYHAIGTLGGNSVREKYSRKSQQGIQSNTEQK